MYETLVSLLAIVFGFSHVSSLDMMVTCRVCSHFFNYYQLLLIRHWVRKSVMVHKTNQSENRVACECGCATPPDSKFLVTVSWCGVSVNRHGQQQQYKQVDM